MGAALAASETAFRDDIAGAEFSFRTPVTIRTDL